MYVAVIEQSNMRVLEVTSNESSSLEAMNAYIRNGVKTYRVIVTANEFAAYCHGKELIGKVLTRNEYISHLESQGLETPDPATLPRFKIVVEVLPMAA